MAATAHKTSEEIQEHFDNAEELQKKALILANWIKESKHFIAFTGAGISTSAGVPDFRGPEGAWTLRATGGTRKSPAVSTLKAVPTKTHMSLVALQKAGILKALVSQNTDGLHRKSGFPPEKLAELHGNSNKETCTNCKKEYIRDFRVREAKEVHDHITTRLCTVCGGKLQDSIINFGENLPERDLDFGFEQGKKADLCLALGSSLRVTPAADIPKEVAKRKRLVICNLQKTPLDDRAALHIHAKTDELMTLVMQYLNQDIPPFVLHRRVLLEPRVFEGVATIDVKGIDVDNLPVTFITKIVVGSKTYDKEPFRLRKHANKLKEGMFKFELNFMGHYGEPPLEMEVNMNEETPKLYCLDYNFNEKKWNVLLNTN